MCWQSRRLYDDVTCLYCCPDMWLRNGFSGTGWRDPSRFTPCTSRSSVACRHSVCGEGERARVSITRDAVVRHTRAGVARGGGGALAALRLRACADSDWVWATPTPMFLGLHTGRDTRSRAFCERMRVVRRCNLVGCGPGHEGCAERAVRGRVDQLPTRLGGAPVTSAVPTAAAVVRFMPTCLAMLMLRRDIVCWLCALVVGLVFRRGTLNGRCQRGIPTPPRKKHVISTHTTPKAVSTGAAMQPRRTFLGYQVRHLSHASHSTPPSRQTPVSPGVPRRVGAVVVCVCSL